MNRNTSIRGGLVLAAIMAACASGVLAQELAPPAPFKLIEAPRLVEQKPEAPVAAVGRPILSTSQASIVGAPVAAVVDPYKLHAEAAPQGSIIAAPAATAPVPALTLEKVPHMPADAEQRFTYELVVRNVGTAPAAQVMVEDVIPGELRLIGAEPRPELQDNRLGWGLGNLEPGAERRCKVQVKLVNSLGALPAATVSYSVSCVLPELQNVGPRLESAPLSAPVTAPLTLKVTGPASVRLGEPAVLNIEMTNNLDVALAKVVLRDILPAGLTRPEGKDIEADLKPFAPRERRTIKLAATATQAGPQVNLTTLSVRGADAGKDVQQVRAETVVRVEELAAAVTRTSAFAMPALAVDIRNRDNVIEVGAETTYEVRVVNQGSGTSTGIQISALLPDGMEPSAAEGPAGHQVFGRQVVFEPLARLDPGREALYRVRARSALAGDWRFKVQLISDQLRLPVCKEESMRIYSDK